MKFKDLTKEDIAEISAIHTNQSLRWDEKLETISKKIGKSKRTAQSWLKKLKISQPIEIPSPQFEEAKKRTYSKDKKIYLITWGQSETPPHDQFLSNLEAYANFLNAEIHVIAGRYKNPTSLKKSAQVKNEETWHPKLQMYLDANRHDINNISVLSDIKIQPTAVNPMSGLYDMLGKKSGIVGSPKVHLEPIPVLEGNDPKVILTTGAVTINRYTDTKAGKKGEQHHEFGFVIVEIDYNQETYFRQVCADYETGSFNDLFYRVENGKVSKINTIESIVLGDIHVGKTDKELIDTTHNFIKNLTPKYIVMHDLFDGYSISHHDAKDPFLLYGKEKNNLNDLDGEIKEIKEFLNQFKIYNNVVIVRSNHDDFLDRWLKGNDWRKLPTLTNSMLYMKYSSMLLDQYEKDPYNVKGLLPKIIEENGYKNVTTLSRSESFMVKDWELAYHGDVGINGTRGSIQQFRKINNKVILGHYHAPERKDGIVSVGTSTKLRLGYNTGPSKWWQSHVIIQNDGNIQHILFKTDKNGNKKFTTFKY